MFGKTKEPDKTPAAEEKKAEEQKKNAPEGKEPQGKPAEPAAKKPSPEEVELASTKLALAAAQAALEASKKETAAMKDQFLRTMADFDNYRKRQARDLEQTVKRANERLIEDLLPVTDHLEVALTKVPEEKDNPFVEGIRMVYTQFVDTLGKNGLTPIDAKGKKFDPAFHEALSQMPSATVPEQFVLDQFRRGWMLGDHVVRPAQVIVSSGKPKETPEQAAADDESVTD